MKSLSDLTETELRDLLQRVGHGVALQLPARSLFVVLAFDDTLTGQYISNANRQDIIRTMREFAAALENLEDTPR